VPRANDAFAARIDPPGQSCHDFGCAQDVLQPHPFEAIVVNDASDLTRLIQRAQQGDAPAQASLYNRIYDELHREAERLVREKGPAAAPSSLVHEGFLRLFRGGQLLDIPSRRYFFFAATRKMRDILVERIRKSHGRPPNSPLDALADEFLEDFRHQTRWDFEAVHNALDRLTQDASARKRRRHQLIELKYFAGMTVKEAAELLEISYSQAREDERLALAELVVELEQLEP
jgi:RNA polymerase sigma factor (TIGR02999 family)